MSFDIYEAFCNLSAAFGPSGRETDTIQAIREVTADNVQNIGDWNHHIDTMNNLIYHRKGSGKKILLVDDVISTGGSLKAMEALVEKAGGTVTGRMAVLAEGGAADRKDILFLEKLPVFNADGSVK